MRSALIVTGLLLAVAAFVGCQRAQAKDAPVTAVAPVCPALVVPLHQPAPDGCARISLDDVGRLPLELNVGGRTVKLAEWTATDETQAELVGFAAQLPSDVIYTVRAGADVFVGGEPRWLNPNGLVGPKVHGIDQVTFCRLPPRPRECLGSGVIIDESLPALAAR
ncbi:MAG: hypothetical protein IT380_25260 [Myxococcales bacterium]|nr:hypothetical protein [Myxococcales bacterium]